MSRPIKFRAWIISKKKHLDVRSISWKGNRDVKYVCCFEPKGNDIYLIDYDAKDVILEQFIDSIDGIDCYVGDIVEELDSRGTYVEGLHVVTEFTEFCTWQGKIVGNIHNNPELLDVK